jgi:Asp-tRNA(Asn)/Glu-tRNA(Gln) amidotransferase A subunit family amidase
VGPLFLSRPTQPPPLVRSGPVAGAAREAPLVAALRSLGALLVGKTQMQEFGVLPTGISPKLGLSRNPHDPTRIVGGSR